jgi:peptidoglycan/xylan/chitin deacetylase (PgdA/CDA1 family)
MCSDSEDLIDTAGMPLGGLPDNLVVTYHYVRPHNSDGVTGITPGDFSQQLTWLSRRYTIVGVDEFVQQRSKRRQLALITFDDAVVDQYRHAFPVLQSHGVPAVFYAPMRPIADGQDFAKYESALGRGDASGRSGWCTQHLLHALAEHLGFARLESAVRVELAGEPQGIPQVDVEAMNRLYHYEVPAKRWLKYLMAFTLSPAKGASLLHAINSRVGLRHEDWFCSISQLREMQAAGHALGGHGFDHLALTTLPLEGQALDLLLAKETMDRHFGTRPRTIAFPFGRADDVTYRIIEQLGYTGSFTTQDRMDCAELAKHIRPQAQVLV